MAEKIIVGPVGKGLKTNVLPFNIDNDSFPYLYNAYQWRGRVKRKRGTSSLTRLRRYFNSDSLSYNPGSATITLNGSGVGNILTDFTTLETNAQLAPGFISVIGGTLTYTDPDADGVLKNAGTPYGSVNYTTGVITIASEAGNAVKAKFSYFPLLPALGIKDKQLSPTQLPSTLSFDTKYSYEIQRNSPFQAYDVSFYKNPPKDAYINSLKKSNWTRCTWNNAEYQQFWTVNYQGAVWTTNGLKNASQVFDTSSLALPKKSIVAVTIISGGPPAVANLQINSHGLEEGDFVYINEVVTTTGINWQTGYVTEYVDANNVKVTFPNATIANAGTGGIAIYLTKTPDTTKDCIRYYDGNPTDGDADDPVLQTGKGWVNFCPPLMYSNFSIGDLPPSIYYLCGARMILPFKDRLLFIGPVVQNSTGSPIYLQDTVAYSQVGTPYYTCSFTGDPTLATTTFEGVLIPENQTATTNAYFSDVTGYGGYVQIGADEPINTADTNRDVVILGLTSMQVNMTYRGDDIFPFAFYVINSELGSGSTFSSISMDAGVITRGQRGFVITNTTGSQRIDLEIPDQVFELDIKNNGNERFTAQRDFINEWIYFTYNRNSATQKTFFPNTTLLYNYRDNSWGMFDENYTCYGTFRKQSGNTWNNIGDTYPTWNDWNVPWNAGVSTVEQPIVICGNSQGYILAKELSTSEAPSLSITGISGTTVTAPNHNLESGEFVYITGCLETVVSGINGKVYVVSNVTANTFNINLTTPYTPANYLGKGQITQFYVPVIQTKQFPAYWNQGRKVRIGTQQYLLTSTSQGQITVQIFLSQDSSNPYNNGPIYPNNASVNESLIYSNIVHTCPESTNLGLTPSNVNLNMLPAFTPQQLWHRMNTSLIGDTVQLAFTLSFEQMTDEDLRYQTAEIELHGFILDISPSQLLA